MTNQQGAPEALRPIARYKIGYAADSWGMRSSTPSGIPDHAGAWVRYEDHVAALVEAQQPAAHVQNQSEIEHVTGDVSKNGPESNKAQQPAPPASEWDVRGHLAASLTCWHRLTEQEADELVDMFQGRRAPAAQQAAPSAAAAGNSDPHAELRKTWQPGQRWQARSFRNGQWGPWTDAVASEPFWFPHQEYRRHPDDLAPQPSPTPQADSQPAPPLDMAVMQLAESVGLIGPASRTNDLHAAIQRFHDLICVNATIKAAVMAADVIRGAAKSARDYPPLPMQFACSGVFPVYSADQMRAYVDADRAARAPADSVTAPAGESGRTDAEIVEQTEELATFLLGWAFNHEPGPDAPAMRDSTHPFALRAWSAACHIQDMLTQTDVQNALAELEDAPESDQLAATPTPPAQAADSVLEDAALLQEARDALWQPANVALCERIDAYLDAARKQGANHD